jgi:hypothetical protein
MLLGQPPDWNKDAAYFLKRFLDTSVGKIFLTQLAYARPSLAAPTGDVNNVAMQSQLVAGYELAISRVMALAEAPPEKQRVVEQYPDLDDEAAWGKRKQAQ